MWEAHFFLKLILCYAEISFTGLLFPKQSMHSLLTWEQFTEGRPRKILTVLSFIYLFIEIYSLCSSDLLKINVAHKI